MNLNYISLKRYLRYLKFPLLFCAAFFAGAAAGKIISHYTQNPASVPSSTQSSSWGLSFQEEGKRPVGNATIEELSQYDAFFAENTVEKKIYLTFDSMEGCAKAIVAKAKEAGVVLTGAGATYPYGKDPKDSNIRIAPSFPTLEDLGKAAEVFVLCVKLTSVEKLLENA